MATTNKEQKLAKLISGTSQWIEKAEWYVQNEDWLKKSALIALKILRTLRAQSISQKALAEDIGVSPQYINKIVKGKENLTLETICRIEKILGITLIEISFFESVITYPEHLSTDTPKISRNATRLLVTQKIAYNNSCEYSQKETSLAA